MTEPMKTLRLDGPRTTMVFVWTDGVPSIVHHGRVLPADTDLAVLAATFVRPLINASLDVNEPVSLHPEGIRGFAGHPALVGTRTGTAGSWGGRFTGTEAETVDDGVIFRLADELRGLRLELDCRIDPETDIATFVTRLTNTGETPFDVDWLAAPTMAPAQRYSEYLSFHGRWCAEFDLSRGKIPIGALLRDNRRGRTSHDAFPGIILLRPETGEDEGACLGCHLGWSGNHRMILERLPTGDVHLQMGVLFLEQEGTLAAGETMTTPPLYVAHTNHGLNGMSAKLHHHVRARLLKFPDPAKPRPVTVNTWEAIYFDHRHEVLTALADAAADVGAERFVLDDGWFRGRSDDTTSLGDWYPDETKYPEGLGPIADYVHGKGMEFGLWVEPEMISPKSNLFQEHPDWVLGLRGYPMLTGRSQHLLDIARPEVSDYLFERIAEAVGSHGIDYLKWDMNRDLVLPANADGEAAACDQIEALYALIDRLLAAFPSLEIESCASGGGRVDYGILRHTHRFWVSDSNDAAERSRIQMGFSYFFPPELMGAHIGPAWSHTSGRGLHTGFRALVASYGHMGVEADLTKMTEPDRIIVRKAIQRYKADRDIWHKGQFKRIRTVDPALNGVIAISPDQEHARLVLTQTDRPRAILPPRLRIPDLDPDRLYNVRHQQMSENIDRANRRFDNPLWQQGFPMSGAVLAAAGIGLPVFYPQTAMAIAIDAAD